MLVSASDDFTVKVWDERARNFIASFELDYQITSVAYSRAETAGLYIFFGGLDNSIKAVNLKKN
jgi:WD40 repeat protein